MRGPSWCFDSHLCLWLIAMGVPNFSEKRRENLEVARAMSGGAPGELGFALAAGGGKDALDSCVSAWVGCCGLG